MAFSQYCEEYAWSDWQRREVRVLHVGHASANTYRSLCEAIAASGSGDRIEVESGDYFEGISIHHCLEIVSTDTGEDPVVTTRGPVLTIATDEPVLLRKMKFVGKGTKVQDTVGVLVVKGQPLIDGCTMSAFQASNSVQPRLINCLITKAEVGSGLRIYDRAGGEYERNEICNHQAHCVEISSSGNPILRANKIWNSSPEATLVSVTGGKHGKACRPVFEDNIISGDGTMPENAAGLVQNETASALARRDFFYIQALFAVTWAASPILRGNTLLRGAVGIHIAEGDLAEDGFAENKIMQCSSWGMYIGPRSTVRTGLNNEFAQCAAGILVKDCKTEVSLRNLSLTVNDVWGLMVDASIPDIQQCSIVANGTGLAFAGNCLGIVISDNNIMHNRLFGVHTTRGAQGKCFNNVISHNMGTGVCVSDGSSPEFVKNNLVGNESHNFLIRKGSYALVRENHFGNAGMYNVLLMQHSDGLFEMNEIEDAVSAQIAVTGKSKGTFINNTIKKCNGPGFLVDGPKTCPNLVSNNFSAVGAAIVIRNEADPFIMMNQVSSCTSGVLVETGGLGTIVENTFRTASEALVIIRSGGDPTIRNNRFDSSRAHGFLVEAGGKGLIEKNILERCGLSLVTIDGAGSHPEIIANTFLDCESEGIISSNNAGGFVHRNHIARTANSLLKLLSGGNTTFTRNTLLDSRNVGICAGPQGKGVVENNTVRGCKISGVTVQSGNETQFTSNEIVDNLRDGMTILADAACNMLGGFISRNGGNGIVVKGAAPMTRLRRVVIKDNGDHEIAAQAGSACVMVHCSVEGTTSGGVLFDGVGEMQLLDCDISGHAVPLAVARGGSGVIERCHIMRGQGEELVAITQQGTLTLRQCRLDVSSANGILVAEGGTAILEECNFLNCDGVAMLQVEPGYLEATACTITNCSVGVKFSPSGHAKHRSPKVSRLHRCVLAGMYNIGALFTSGCKGSLVECEIKTSPNGVTVMSGAYVQMKDTKITKCASEAVRVEQTPAPGSLITGTIVVENETVGVKMIETEELMWVGGRIEENQIGMLVDGGKPTIAETEFVCNNEAGLLLNHRNTSEIRDCVFSRNDNSGIRVKEGSHPVIARCHFVKGDFGVQFIGGGHGKVTDSTFSQNGVSVSLIPNDFSSLSFDATAAQYPNAKLSILTSKFENSLTALEVRDALECDVVECSFFHSKVCAVLFGDRSRAKVSKSTIFKGATGVRALRGSCGSVVECNIYENRDGLEVDDECCTVFAANHVFDNLMSGASIENNAHLILQSNTFRKNQIGLSLKDGASLRVAHNTFENEACGIQFSGTCTALVEENVFEESRVGIDMVGLIGHPTVSTNLFVRNEVGCRNKGRGTIKYVSNVFRANLKAGLATEADAKPEVDSCVFEKHPENAAAIRVGPNGGGTFSNSIFSSNYCGVVVANSYLAKFQGNVFTGSVDFSIKIEAGGGGLFDGNSFKEGHRGDVVAKGMTAHDLVFTRNFFGSPTRGISFVEGAKGTVERNVFDGPGSTAIFASGTSLPTVRENFFKEVDIGVLLEAGGSGSYSGCIMMGCGTGIWARNRGRGTFTACSIVGSRLHAIFVDHDSEISVEQSTVGGLATAMKPVISFRGAGTLTSSLICGGNVAVHCHDDAHFVLSNCRIKESKTGVSMAGGTKAEIIGNNIFLVDSGVVIAANAGGKVVTNYIVQCFKFCLTLLGEAPDCEIEGNVILGIGEDAALQGDAARELSKRNQVKNNVGNAPTNLESGSVAASVPQSLPKDASLMRTVASWMGDYADQVDDEGSSSANAATRRSTAKRGLARMKSLVSANATSVSDLLGGLLRKVTKEQLLARANWKDGPSQSAMNMVFGLDGSLEMSVSGATTPAAQHVQLPPKKPINRVSIAQSSPNYSSSKKTSRAFSTSSTGTRDSLKGPPSVLHSDKERTSFEALMLDTSLFKASPATVKASLSPPLRKRTSRSGSTGGGKKKATVSVSPPAKKIFKTKPMKSDAPKEDEAPKTEALEKPEGKKKSSSPPASGKDDKNENKKKNLKKLVAVTQVVKEHVKQKLKIARRHAPQGKAEAKKEEDKPALRQSPINLFAAEPPPIEVDRASSASSLSDGQNGHEYDAPLVNFEMPRDEQIPHTPGSRSYLLTEEEEEEHRKKMGEIQAQMDALSRKAALLAQQREALARSLTPRTSAIEQDEITHPPPMSIDDVPPVEGETDEEREARYLELCKVSYRYTAEEEAEHLKRMAEMQAKIEDLEARAARLATKREEIASSITPKAQTLQPSADGAKLLAGEQSLSAVVHADREGGRSPSAHSSSGRATPIVGNASYRYTAQEEEAHSNRMKQMQSKMEELERRAVELAAERRLVASTISGAKAKSPEEQDPLKTPSPTHQQRLSMDRDSPPLQNNHGSSVSPQLPSTPQAKSRARRAFQFRPPQQQQQQQQELLGTEPPPMSESHSAGRTRRRDDDTLLVGAITVQRLVGDDDTASSPTPTSRRQLEEILPVIASTYGFRGEGDTGTTKRNGIESGEVRFPTVPTTQPLSPASPRRNKAGPAPSLSPKQSQRGIERNRRHQVENKGEAMSLPTSNCWASPLASRSARQASTTVLELSPTQGGIEPTPMGSSSRSPRRRIKYNQQQQQQQQLEKNQFVVDLTCPAESSPYLRKEHEVVGLGKYLDSIEKGVVERRRRKSRNRGSDGEEEDYVDDEEQDQVYQEALRKTLPPSLAMLVKRYGMEQMLNLDLPAPESQQLAQTARTLPHCQN